MLGDLLFLALVLWVGDMSIRLRPHAPQKGHFWSQDIPLDFQPLHVGVGASPFHVSILLTSLFVDSSVNLVIILLFS